ncbi:unannotated protein [freshwater metagenome]|uniref:Unannotated protein n=1 Tax=freshwater metagenome TaxID=449393 RepID=A0A6J6Z4Z1_9ZZZZ
MHMGRVLIVANETLRSEELYDAVLARAAAGHTLRFVVPLRIPRYADLGGLSMYGFVSLEAADADAVERDGCARLDEVLARLDRDGVRATGRVRCVDPMAAIDRELERHLVDEIIVSTKARAISRWLGVDLPRRVERRFAAVKVTTIENRVRVNAVAG